MASPPRKRPWSQPLADFVGATVSPVLARQGFSESDLILHWDDIVGERLAANSRPIKLQWAPRPASPPSDAGPQTATLVVRVESGFALALQHMADQVLARINAHLGWRCVGRLMFKQGPIERSTTSRRSGKAPSPERLAAATAHAAGIDDAELSAALIRLGAHILK